MKAGMLNVTQHCLLLLQMCLVDIFLNHIGNVCGSSTFYGSSIFECSLLIDPYYFTALGEVIFSIVS